MRTIKFRGKNTETGEWVYGFYTQGNYVNGDGTMIVRHIIHFDFLYDVEERTIGQHTGLQDKNGVEIYEGDILQETYSNKNVLVVYDAPQFCYADNCFGYRFLNHPENFTVVGNIHDNPDLLKGE